MKSEGIMFKLIKANGFTSLLVKNSFSSSAIKNVSNQTNQAIESNEPDKLYRKIRLECRGNDFEVLNSYETFALAAAKHLGINVENVETPKATFEKRILLRSAHVHKKHREHYEWRTNYKIFTLKHLTGSTADTYLEYVQRNLPEGVAMIVHKYELQRLPSHLKAPTK